MSTNKVEAVSIRTEYIQLDQFLKYAGITQTGGQIRGFLEDEAIYVNETLCTAKRKKLFPGDIVEIRGVGAFAIVANDEESGDSL